jgi:hypothetical protein
MKFEARLANALFGHHVIIITMEELSYCQRMYRVLYHCVFRLFRTKIKLSKYVIACT